jgi:hypothetical protein
MNPFDLTPAALTRDSQLPPMTGGPPSDIFGSCGLGLSNLLSTARSRPATSGAICGPMASDIEYCHTLHLVEGVSKLGTESTQNLGGLFESLYRWMASSC